MNILLSGIVGSTAYGLARPGVIYGLCGQDGKIRYVGQTRQGIRRRLSGHLCAPKRKHGHLPVNRWIAKLQAAGLEPTIRVIEGPMPVEDLNEAEQRHIRELREQGADLLNVSSGGQSVGVTWSMPEEAIRRSAAAKIGRPRSPETRAKLSAANLGKTASDETRQKMSESLRGKKQTPEWIEKRRLAVAATKAAKPRPECCSHGHPWTEENTRWYKGNRNCRACARERTRRVRAHHYAPEVVSA